MAQPDGHDVARVDADAFERPLERIAVSGRQLRVHTVRVKAPVENRVAHERRVETGVEQHPSAVNLAQHARDRLAQAHVRVGTVARVDRDGDRQFLPAERERDDAPHAIAVLMRHLPAS